MTIAFQSASALDEVIARVAHRLVSLDGHDESDSSSLSRQQRARIGYFSRDFGMGHWDWPQGVALFALSQEGENYCDYIDLWVRQQIDQGLPVPNINTVAPLLALVGDERYEDLCLEWADRIVHQFGRTKESGLQHNTTGAVKHDLTINPQQIWVDTVFMSVLFLAKMGVRYGNSVWIDEAIYQVLLHVKYLLDRESGLFYHAWDFSTRSAFGRNFWCRGNSWMCMAIPLLIELLEDFLTPPVRLFLTNVYTNQVDRLLSVRDPQSQLWRTIVDHPDGYLETSGSAGIVAGIFMGLSGGLLDPAAYAPAAAASLEALTGKIGDDGTVADVSAGTVVSHSAQDYKNIIRKPMVYGQALVLQALIESRRWQQK